MKAKPFLKWAGGKNKLLNTLRNFYPIELKQGKINTYIEPFLGGGAVFLDIIQNHNLESVYLSDCNPDLILSYQVIQQYSPQLIKTLSNYQTKYYSLDLLERKDYFYKIRSNFNDSKPSINYQNFSELWLTRVAQLIFLNKTCFNGLFRLNSKGEFNVPFGRYKNPKILDIDNINLVAKLLQNVKIKTANYSDCYYWCDRNTFIYFDPPYRPLNQTSSFTNYAGLNFTDNDQIKLANFYQKLHLEKQAKLMLSNSDPKNINPDDNFFDDLYSNFNIYRINAKRSINCQGDKRGNITEILVTNY